jgi:class 3 adenylate cyclase
VASNSPEEPNADRQRLADLLRRLGATDAEARTAAAGPGGGDFALELNLRSGPPLTVEDAARRTGLGGDEFVRLLRAFGIAPAAPGTAAVPLDIVEAIPVISDAAGLLGEDTVLGIARVLGSTSGRLAEALVDAFRTGFEVPSLSAGTSYVDVVEQYVELTRAALPPFLDLLAAVVKAHLVKVSYGAWTPDVENQAARRDLFVGFVDLVGYTALSRTLTPRELATLLARFEDLVADVVTAGGGRLVKLIGDGAMFVCDAPTTGCRVALALCDRLAVDETLPPARVGADYGSVLSLYGDYFGEVVNRAARLVALANPGTVVVSDSTAAGTDDKSFGLERLPAQALKGFHAPAVTYRLLPA